VTVTASHVPEGKEGVRFLRRWGKRGDVNSGGKGKGGKTLHLICSWGKEKENEKSLNNQLSNKGGCWEKGGGGGKGRATSQIEGGRWRKAASITVSDQK